TNEWVDYAVDVQAAGSYKVDFRVASVPGNAQLQLRNSAGTPLGSVNVGNTGGWQNWITVNATVTLPAGTQTLRVFAAASTGCNLNYLTFAAAGGSGSTACTGTVASGDYSYEASTTSGTVNWKFIPLAPIAGSSMAIIYVKVGAGGYAGYPMTAAGSNFTFAQPQASGAALSFYFTYRVGSGMAERNSAATPHSYSVGTTCPGSRAALASSRTTAASQAQLYPNPANTQLTVPTTGRATLTITDVLGRVVHTESVPGNQPATVVDVHSLRPGSYFLTLREAAGPATVQRFVKE
ncbi:MAG: carbohydrate-binding protein, partial [Hymenobacter sp.]|nr:carbohydrate-binding protein [Hymenobacter sp.]